MVGAAVLAALLLEPVPDALPVLVALPVMLVPLVTPAAWRTMTNSATQRLPFATSLPPL